MSIRVALIYDSVFPVKGYGGTERLVWWLAKGLAELDHEPIIVGLSGSSCPFAKVVEAERPFPPKQLPPADFYHYFNTPPEEPSVPHLITIGGNAKAGEKFLPNTVFISRNHAERHGGKVFVYNGVDPDDCLFKDQKKSHLAFLAKASWRVKNVKGAVKVARRSGNPLEIMGGSRVLFKNWRGVHWVGEIGGLEKLQILSSAKGLLFPVLWNEPFGLAVVESMLCGTPVLATPFGSLPELVGKPAGKICHSYSEMIEACQHLESYRPAEVRDWAIENFSHLKMAKSYLDLYFKVLNGEKLNPFPIVVQKDQGGILKFS